MSKERVVKRMESLGIDVDFSKNILELEKDLDLIKHQTKENIFKLSKNWQSGRTAIRKDACKVFKESGKEYKCLACGYDTHVEIAHIKAVSEFDGDCYMEEINHIDNLMALCPNHH